LLNNFEVSSEYIIKLKKEIELEGQTIFNTIEPKLRSGLDDLVDVSNNFRRMLQNFLQQVSLSLTGKLKSQIDSYAFITYELSEIDFSDREINDPFVQNFILVLDTVFQPYKVSLTPSNYDNLIHIIIKFISTRLEHEILKKKFNQLGGLQLDKEIRVLQNYFASISQKTVRDKFARLTQMAALLYLENVTNLSNLM